MTPHERRMHYENRAVESQYEHDEMQEIMADWTEDLKDMTDAELFSHEVDLHRIGRMFMSMAGYIPVERARRAD